MNIQSIVSFIFEKACVPIVVAIITYVITKKQATNTIITQSRQKWIDDLRNCIALYITKAEMISMIDLDDNKSYFDHFKDLSQTQNKLELMLNPYEDDHNKILVEMEEIRELIHDKKIKPDKLEKLLDEKIEVLLNDSKDVLKREWLTVKKGK